MRRLAALTATVLATVGVALIVWELRAALVLFLLAIAVSAAIRPLVDAWARAGLPLPVALGLTWVIGLLGPGLLLVYVVSNPLVEDIQGVVDGLLPPLDRLREQWSHGNALERLLAERVPAAHAARLGTSSLSEVVRPAVGVGVGIFGFLGELVILAILSIFWTTNRDTFERIWLSLVPAAHRPFARSTWVAVKTAVGAQVRAEVTEAALASAMLYVGFASIGLAHPVLPAVAGGLSLLIPLVGWCLALVVTFTAGLVTDPMLALYATAYTAIVLITLEAVITPRVLRPRRYGPLLVTLVVVGLAEVAGLAGLIFAPLIAAAIQTLFEQLVSSSEPRPPAAPPGLAELRARLDALRTQLASTPSLADAPELASLVERLEALLAKTEESLSEAGAPATVI